MQTVALPDAPSHPKKLVFAISFKSYPKDFVDIILQTQKVGWQQEKYERKAPSSLGFENVGGVDCPVCMNCNAWMQIAGARGWYKCDKYVKGGNNSPKCFALAPGPIIAYLAVAANRDKITEITSKEVPPKPVLDLTKYKSAAAAAKPKLATMAPKAAKASKRTSETKGERKVKKAKSGK